MIARHWKGTVKPGEGANYLRHLTEETFPAMARLEGFQGVRVMSRDTNAGVEFLVVSEWDSVSAIGRFAGADVAVAVVPPKVQSMMAFFDAKAEHYELIAEYPG